MRSTAAEVGVRLYYEQNSAEVSEHVVALISNARREGAQRPSREAAALVHRRVGRVLGPHGLDPEAEMMIRDLVVNPEPEQGHVLRDFFDEGARSFLTLYTLGQARSAFLEELYGKGMIQRILERAGSMVGSDDARPVVLSTRAIGSGVVAPDVADWRPALPALQRSQLAARAGVRTGGRRQRRHRQSGDGPGHGQAPQPRTGAQPRRVGVIQSHRRGAFLHQPGTLHDLGRRSVHVPPLPLEGSSVLLEAATGYQPSRQEPFANLRLDAERQFPIAGRVRWVTLGGIGTPFGGRLAREFYLSSFDTLGGVLFGDPAWLLGAFVLDSRGRSRPRRRTENARERRAMRRAFAAARRAAHFRRGAPRRSGPALSRGGARKPQGARRGRSGNRSRRC